MKEGTTYRQIKKMPKERCDCGVPVCEHFFEYGMWKPHQPRSGASPDSREGAAGRSKEGTPYPTTSYQSKGVKNADSGRSAK